MFSSSIFSWWDVKCGFQKESKIYSHMQVFLEGYVPTLLKPMCLTLLSQTINQNYPETFLARGEESFGDRAFNKKIGWQQKKGVGRWGRCFLRPYLKAKECKRELKPHFCLIRARIQTAPPGKHHSSCLSGRSCSPVAKWVEQLNIRIRCSFTSLLWPKLSSQSTITREQSEEGVESHLPDFQLMPVPPVSGKVFLAKTI